jgi:hypothetical protein
VRPQAESPPSWLGYRPWAMPWAREPVAPPTEGIAARLCKGTYYLFPDSRVAFFVQLAIGIRVESILESFSLECRGPPTPTPGPAAHCTARLPPLTRVALSAVLLKTRSPRVKTGHPVHNNREFKTIRIHVNTVHQRGSRLIPSLFVQDWSGRVGLRTMD